MAFELTTAPPLPGGLAADDQVLIVRGESVYSLDQADLPSGGGGGDGAQIMANLAALKAAATSLGSVIYDSATWKWTLGDYTGLNDDVNVVKADSTSVATGAWVRQTAAKVAASGGTNVQAALDSKASVSKFIDLSNPLSVTGATSLASGDVNRYVIVSGTTSDYTLKLPPTSTVGDGVQIDISRACTKMITIEPATGSSASIDGKSAQIMWAGEKALLVFDGANWKAQDRLSIPFVAELVCTSNVTLTADTGNHLALAIGTQLQDLNLTPWFSTNKFVTPREGLWDVDLHLWIDNISAACQVDVGIAVDVMANAPSLPDAKYFDRLHATGTGFGLYEKLCVTQHRRVSKGYHIAPVIRPLSPTTTCRVPGADVVTVMTVKEVPLW